MGEGKGGMVWENVKRIASPDSMLDTGCSGLVHWDDPEGWEVGGGFRMENTCNNE